MYHHQHQHQHHKRRRRPRPPRPEMHISAPGGWTLVAILLVGAVAAAGAALAAQKVSENVTQPLDEQDRVHETASRQQQQLGPNTTTGRDDQLTSSSSPASHHYEQLIRQLNQPQADEGPHQYLGQEVRHFGQLGQPGAPVGPVEPTGGQQQQQQQAASGGYQTPLASFGIAQTAAQGPEMLVVEPTEQSAGHPQLEQQQQQVLARLYIDQFGNQQLGIAPPPSPPQVQLQRQRQLDAASQSGRQYVSPSDFYNTNSPPGGERQPHQQPRGARADESRLTNGQLVALIDELKEFNARQTALATGGGGGAPSPPARGDTKAAAGADEHEDNQRHEDSDNEDEDDDGGGGGGGSSSSEAQPRASAGAAAATSATTARRRSSSGGRGSEPAGATGAPPVSSADLERFARFLMSREGAELRFQLGLDKDSPDDGDEAEERDRDDHDAHLRRRRRKSAGAAAAGDGRLQQLDRRLPEAASGMDQLVANLLSVSDRVEVQRGAARAAAAAAAARRKGKQAGAARAPAGAAHALREATNEDELLARRAKRASKPAGPQSQGAPGGHRAVGPKETRPFIAKLIGDELELDAKSGGRRGWAESAPQAARPPGDSRPELSTSEVKQQAGGSGPVEYPKRARRRDHMVLLHELQRARQEKARLRSRGLDGDPTPGDNVVRQSLDGKLGMRTELQPDGKLVLRSNKGPNSISLQLPVTKQQQQHQHQDQQPVGAVDRDDKPTAATGSEQSSGAEPARVSLKSGSEYPISERVSERLTRLNENLDRYFNDGFLSEADRVQRRTRGNSAGGQPQAAAESSNVVSGNETARTAPRDHDFDVDVSIDGKRDAPEHPDEEEDDYPSGHDPDEDEDRDRDDERNASHSPKGKPKAQRRVVHPIKAAAGRPTRKVVTSEAGMDSSGSVRRDIAAGHESIRFLGGGPAADQLGRGRRLRADPVDSESMDTPIGPDARDARDDGDDIGEPLEAIKATPSTQAKRDTTRGGNKLEKSASRESRQLKHSYGKRMAPRFFEEPEW